MNKISARFSRIVLGAGLLGFAGELPVRADNTIIDWNGSTADYQTPGDWSSLSVPDLTTTNTARISGGAVTYNPGGDLVIKNGGVLEVSGGSWSQSTGTAFIQLNGNGTILVDGGTFNQGTASSMPFNLNATTGNSFLITSGTANFTTNYTLDTPGLSFLQSGGTVNFGANEIDMSATTMTISGGVMNASLITGANDRSGLTETITLSGGAIDLSDSRGFFNPNASHYVNFTLGSTGTMHFANSSVATVDGLIGAGALQYNNTQGLSNFVVSDLGGGNISVSLLIVPEPSTWAMLGFGLLALAAALGRGRGEKGAICGWSMAFAV